MAVRLSVNINKVALLRNSRGANLPDLVKVARDCQDFGAEGITVHPRPDERHVRYADLIDLKENCRTEFNIEGFPSEKFVGAVLACKPDQCTLVPDPPGVLTSDTGWDTVANQSFLQDVISRFKERGIRVSLFMNPEERMINAAAKTGADRIELYTGEYAKDYALGNYGELKKQRLAAELALECGLGLNAGHDLNLDNLRTYKEEIPGLLEVSIGHALICDALYWGLENTIQMYLARLQ